MRTCAIIHPLHLELETAEFINGLSNGECMRSPAPQPMRREHPKLASILEICGNTTEIVRINEERKAVSDEVWAVTEDIVVIADAFVFNIGTLPLGHISANRPHDADVKQCEVLSPLFRDCSELASLIHNEVLKHLER